MLTILTTRLIVVACLVEFVSFPGNFVLIPPDSFFFLAAGRSNRSISGARNQFIKGDDFLAGRRNDCKYDERAGNMDFTTASPGKISTSGYSTLLHNNTRISQ